MIDEAFRDLSPAELKALKAEHVSSKTAVTFDRSGPPCQKCKNEAWPCRVARLIRMWEAYE